MPASDPDTKASTAKTHDVKPSDLKAKEVKAAAGSPEHEAVSVEAKSEKTKDVTVAKLLTVHSAQEKITITLYQFRTLVSLGVLGFVYHEKEFAYNWMVKSALSFGFILFAIGNAKGSVASQRITYSVSNALKKAAASYGETSEVLIAHDAITPGKMWLYQIVLSGIVLIAMWFPNISAFFGLGRN